MARTIDLQHIDAHWKQFGQVGHPSLAAAALLTLANTFGPVDWRHSFKKQSSVSYLTNLTTTSHDVRHLLLATGVGMTNAADGTASEAWYAVLRHSATFVINGTQLQGSPSQIGIDTHRRAVMSDELGIGACLMVMTKHYKAAYAVDTEAYMRAAGTFGGATKGSVRARYKKSPPKNASINSDSSKKTPDFIMLDTTGCFRPVEAKGTFDWGNRNAALSKGKKQACNIELKGVAKIGAPFVVCTVFPDARTKTNPTLPITIVLDPTERDDAKPIEVDSERLIRLALANTVAFLGFTTSALSFLDGDGLGEFASLLRQQPIRLRGADYIPIAQAKSGWTFVYHLTVARALLAVERDADEVLGGLLAGQRFDFTMDEFARDEEDRIILGTGFGMVRWPQMLFEENAAVGRAAAPRRKPEASRGLDAGREQFVATAGADALALAGTVRDAGGSEEESIAALLFCVVNGRADNETLTSVRNLFGYAVADMVVRLKALQPWHETTHGAPGDVAGLASADPSTLIIVLAERLNHARKVLSDIQRSALSTSLSSVADAAMMTVHGFHAVITAQATAIRDKRREPLVRELMRAATEIEGLAARMRAKVATDVFVRLRQT